MFPPALVLDRRVGRSRRHHPPRYPDAAAVSIEAVRASLTRRPIRETERRVRHRMGLATGLGMEENQTGQRQQYQEECNV